MHSNPDNKYFLPDQVSIIYFSNSSFDEMDFEESHNDLYDVGLQNDLFKQAAKLDEKCTVKAKTP